MTILQKVTISLNVLHNYFSGLQLFLAKLCSFCVTIRTYPDKLA